MKKRLLFTVSVFALLLISPASFSCDSLEACIAKYPSVARGASGISDREYDLAVQVRRYGADAIPHLIVLLDHEDSGVRQLAAYTINDIEGLEPEHFKALKRAALNGEEWTLGAISRIGTPEAIEFLVEEFRKNPNSGSTLAIALRRLGSNGAPYIAELLACQMQCSERLLRAVVSVFRELKEEGLTAAPRLLQIATDERFHISSRESAIISIGLIGKPAKSFVTQLIALKASSSLLEPAIDRALVNIGLKEALPGLIQTLPDSPYFTLRDMMTLGEAGYDAGPIVIDYLDAPDWDVRVLAAEVLGYIGYTTASPILVDILSNNQDWKLQYAAILSLGRLGEKQYLNELESLRISHWYPPVRAAADVSIQHIRAGTEIDVNHWWRSSTAENSPETCRAVNYTSVDELDGTKLYLSREQDKEQLELLSYEIEISAIGAAEDTEPNEHGVIEITPENMVEHTERVQQLPDVGLRVANGWLVGSSRGEWGGELVHVSSSGERSFLGSYNVRDIFRLGDRIVATTGLAHLGGNWGMLIEIDESEHGTYSAQPWRRLPAAPFSSWLIEGNKLLVNTLRGGSVVVSDDGNLSMAECVAVISDG